MSGSSRDSLQEAILELGDIAEGEIQLLAMRLSSRFQQSGLTIDRIEEEIRKVRDVRLQAKASDGSELFSGDRN
jgi:hypothetical protein